MKHAQNGTPDNLQHNLMQWLKGNISRANSVEMLTLLAKTLPLAKLGSVMQRDITETILEITPAAGEIAPVTTIEALSKSILWVKNEYIPHFARAILIMEKPALDANLNAALAAIEQSLLVCYSVILPQDIHGTGRCNDRCLEWQRYTFLSVLNAIETRGHLIDPSILESLLKISEIMTDISPQLSDINERIRFLTCAEKTDSLTWH